MNPYPQPQRGPESTIAESFDSFLVAWCPNRAELTPAQIEVLRDSFYCGAVAMLAVCSRGHGEAAQAELEDFRKSVSKRSAERN